MSHGLKRYMMKRSFLSLKTNIDKPLFEWVGQEIMMFRKERSNELNYPKE